MQKIRIDFDNPGLPQHISAVENDSQSRFFQATLYENGKAYTAPEGAAYSIMYRGFGPQNQGWYDTINDGAGKRAACAVSGNVVTCEIARQALQVPGHVSIVLCVTTGKGYMLKSWPIECDCKNDRYDSTAEIQSFFYVTQVSNESWTQAIQAVEELKNTIDPTLSLSGKAADAAKVGEAVNAETTRAKAAEEENAKGIGRLEEDFENQSEILNERIYIHSKLNANTQGGSIDTLYNGKANETYKIKLLNIDNSNWAGNANYLFHEDGTYDTVSGFFNKIGDEVEFVAPNDFVMFRVFFTYKEFFKQDCHVYFLFEPKGKGIAGEIVKLKSDVDELKKEKPHKNYKAMGILGDSYSTFRGWIPTGDGVTSQSNETFYPQGEITKVSQTWWHLLCNKMGCTLFKNDSWSGATIAVGEYPVTSFVKRAEKTFGSDSTLKPKPDILFVFGGTNDMWQSVDKGTLKYSDWTNDDLKKSLPALCYIFDLLKTYNPGTYIVFVMNTVSVISDSNFRNGITDACEHYGIKLIKITGLSQLVNIHPQISEMQEICNQIYDGLVN